MTPKSLALFTWDTVLLPNTKFTCGIILCLPKYNTLHFFYMIYWAAISQTIAVDHLYYSANHYNQVDCPRPSKAWYHRRIVYLGTIVLPVMLNDANNGH